VTNLPYLGGTRDALPVQSTGASSAKRHVPARLQHEDQNWPLRRVVFFTVWRPDDLAELESQLRKGLQPIDTQRSMAEVNAHTAQRSEQYRALKGLAGTISTPCVTGHLLASGSAEIMPHAIPDRDAYLPSFVIRQFGSGGVAGLEVKRDADGRPLPPVWRGMTIRVRSREPLAVVTLHAIGNVGPPVAGPRSNPNVTTYWKVADEHEPPVQFRIERSH
jgi:hypothetical protein